MGTFSNTMALAILLSLSVFMTNTSQAAEQSTTELRKIATSGTEASIGAFLELNSRYHIAIKNMPAYLDFGLDEDTNSLAASMWANDASTKEIVDTLIFEASYLQPYSQIALSVIYKSEIKKDINSLIASKVFKYYQECSKEQIPRCMLSLGEIHLLAIGIEKNYKKGVTLLVDSGLGDSYEILGDYFYSMQNYEYAEMAYIAAQDRGNNSSTLNLVNTLALQGRYDETYSYLIAAIEKQPFDHMFLYLVAVNHLNGWGISQDIPAAIHLLSYVIADLEANSDLDEYELLNSAYNMISIAYYQLGAGLIKEDDRYTNYSNKPNSGSFTLSLPHNAHYENLMGKDITTVLPIKNVNTSTINLAQEVLLKASVYEHEQTTCALNAITAISGNFDAKSLSATIESKCGQN